MIEFFCLLTPMTPTAVEVNLIFVGGLLKTTLIHHEIKVVACQLDVQVKNADLLNFVSNVSNATE